MNLEDYLDNPCKKLSIPYWKNKQMDLPKNIVVLHKDEFSKSNRKFIKVDQFFRLIHKLSNKSFSSNPMVDTININTDMVQLINLINLCYEKEKINIKSTDIIQWIKRNTYREDLWVKMVVDGKLIASGIAEIDAEAKEGILEWIQVDPLFQGKGYGKIIVNELIYRLSKTVDFITVSGRVENEANPQRLYKSCGFEGDDIWYICYVS
ncbi:MAG: GNAT family N-acetyltransferase [Bacilli bacterium]|nr:GNAT family N-acetyltransferase [Bacilli bacterium]